MGNQNVFTKQGDPGWTTTFYSNEYRMGVHQVTYKVNQIKEDDRSGVVFGIHKSENAFIASLDNCKSQAVAINAQGFE